MKPSWDWSKNFWADAFDSAATKVQGHKGDSDDSGSSDDESSEEDEEGPGNERQGSRLAMNRDGTIATASQAELKLAAELAKDPWGRWGGRGGKMARIREHEAAEAKATRERLGLPPSGSRDASGPPSTSSPNLKTGKNTGTDKEESKSSSKNRIVIVVAIKDEQRNEKLRVKFKQTPKTGWWGAAYFLSAGAMEGMEDEEETDKDKEKKTQGEGFKEADQEALYMLCHDHQRVGKRGLGKSTKLKIEGGNWEGSKKVFEDDDDEEPVKKKSRKDPFPAHREKGQDKKSQGVVELAKDLLRAAPKNQMKIGKLFRLLESQTSLDKEALQKGKKAVKRGSFEGLEFNKEERRVKLIKR